MSVYTYSFQSAQQNFATNRLARWHTSSNEKVGNKPPRNGPDGRRVFRPGVEFMQKISPGNSFLRSALALPARWNGARDDRVQRPVAQAQQSHRSEPDIGYTNRYNTASILNQLKWAAGEPFPANGFAEVRAGAFVDLHSHPVIGVKSGDEIRSLREALTTYFAQIYWPTWLLSHSG